jgi:hypothetical protein
VAKSEERRPVRRLKRREEDGSEWILGRWAGGGGVEWIQLAQDRDGWWALVNAVMNLRVLASQSYLS